MYGNCPQVKALGTNLVEPNLFHHFLELHYADKAANRVREIPIGFAIAAQPATQNRHYFIEVKSVESTDNARPWPYQLQTNNPASRFNYSTLFCEEKIDVSHVAQCETVESTVKAIIAEGQSQGITHNEIDAAKPLFLCLNLTAVEHFRAQIQTYHRISAPSKLQGHISGSRSHIKRPPSIRTRKINCDSAPPIILPPAH
jgi:hypothetical protein